MHIHTLIVHILHVCIYLLYDNYTYNVKNAYAIVYTMQQDHVIYEVYSQSVTSSSLENVSKPRVYGMGMRLKWYRHT